MTRLTQQGVHGLFTRIARRYDLMNHLMTGGQDVCWRRDVIRRAHLRPNTSLLDLGTGTGDLAREALRQFPATRLAAVDFTMAMMRVGQRVGPLPFCAADALRIPFADASFDAVVSGFLMRNVTDVQQALQEQYRALKPGGRIVILDTTRPQQNLLSPFIWIHMHLVIPALGRIVSGEPDAYRYLPDSTEDFLTAEQLASHMIAAGFRKVDFKRLMFGTIAIHWGER